MYAACLCMCLENYSITNAQFKENKARRPSAPAEREYLPTAERPKSEKNEGYERAADSSPQTAILKAIFAIFEKKR